MTSGPSLGAALSGATTAEAEAPRARSGAPEGPTSCCFFGTGTMMRPRFCGVGAEEDDEEEAADATIVAER